MMLAQSNPVPFVNQPLVPSAIAPAGPSFTLTVNGTGFVSGSVVNWNGTPLSTTFVSDSQLTATVPASNIATPSTSSITVSSPSPGGGTSNVLFLAVAAPETSVQFAAVNSNTQVISMNRHPSSEILPGTGSSTSLRTTRMDRTLTPSFPFLLTIMAPSKGQW